MKNKYKKPLERIAKSGTHVKTDDLVYIVEQFVALEEQKIKNLKLEISTQLRGIICDMTMLNQAFEQCVNAGYCVDKKSIHENIEALQSIDNYLENTDEY